MILKMGNIIGITFIIAVYLIFFQDIAFIVGKQALYLSPVFIITALFLCFLHNYQKYLNKLVYILFKTPVKYMMFFVFWVLISSCFCGGMGTVLKCIFKFILIYGLTVIPAVLLPMYVFPKYIKSKKILKIFVGIYLFIMLYGIFHYVAQALHIDFLTNIHKLFCTKQFLTGQDSGYVQFFASTRGTVTRAMSTFFEASFFATFLFVFMPFVYKIADSSFKVVKNSFLNKSIKISMVFLTWLNLLLTLSPIYLVFCSIYTFIYYYKKIIRMVSKYTLTFLIICILIITPLLIFIVMEESVINANNKIIRRIGKTAISFGSMEKLVENEPSLATRVIANYNGLMVCLKYHPIKGTGYGNAKQDIIYSMTHSDVPLTGELQWIFYVFDDEQADAPPCIFFSVICQTGIVGVLLLYLFIIYTILSANKVKKYFIGNNRLLLDSSYLISINFVIVSFYWSFESYPMMWFILGILLSYILLFNTKIKKRIVATRQLLSANKEEH